MSSPTTAVRPQPASPPRASPLRHVLRGRFALLFVFLLSSIVVYPYAEVSGLGFYAFRVLNTLVIALTLYAVTFSHRVFLLLLVLAVPSLVHHVLLPTHATGTVALGSRLLSLAFNGTVIVLIFWHVFGTERSARPDSETIFGALCVYLQLGFTFSSVYAALANYYPESFYLNPATNHHLIPDRFDLLYYSFGTLTELGTSGITAVLPFARSLSLLEAITGILYLAVLISRLLAAYRSVEERQEAAIARNG